MNETWVSRIKRADRLASERAESRELLEFYAALLRSQMDIYECLRTLKSWLPSGQLAEDWQSIRRLWPALLDTVRANGPEPLASEAEHLLLTNERESLALLNDYWRAPADTRFFEKAFLQPYACWLRETGVKFRELDFHREENRCPFCSGKPQVSVLQIKEALSQSGGRDLICSICLAAWPFRRVACASCSEENPSKIGYYHSPEYEYIRIEACDTCNHYIKTVDLTKYGLAVPLVDEVAAAPLDLWARGRGHIKIELNLVGL